MSPIPTAEYRVEFVEGHDQKAAQNQAGLIEELGKLGWEWAGFVAVSRAVVVKHEDIHIVGAATETAGMFLYFKRLTTDVQTVTPGEAIALGGHRIPRAARRRAAREATKLGGRIN